MHSSIIKFVNETKGEATYREIRAVVDFATT